MKRTAIILAAMVLMAPIALRAQRVSEDKLSLTVTGVSIDDVRWDDVYPTVRGLRGVRSGGRSQYLRITLQVKIEDTRSTAEVRREGPPWISLMEVDWVVVPAMGPDGARGTPLPDTSARFTRTVRYSNVKGGTDQWIMIFIHPDTRDQWLNSINTNNIFFQATFRYGGRTRETVFSQGSRFARTEREAPGQTAQWLATERTINVPYQLLTRHETPFGFASEDYFPRIVIQPEQR